MRRLLLAGIAAAPLLLMQPTHSDAVIVECANCATSWDQIASNAKQALQYASQLEQKAAELQSAALMAQNTVALPQQIWANVQGDIQQVRSLANAASLLTGNSGSMMSRLSNASGYATQVGMTPQQISNQFNMWQQTIANASNSLGRTIGVQQGQEQNYAALQARLQLQSGSAVGQLQAIQAGNGLAALTSQQLNQLSVTLTAAAQEQATRGLVAEDRTASEDAATLRWLGQDHPPLITAGNGY